MKLSIAALALPFAVQAAQFSKAEYASGQVFKKLMKLKTDSVDRILAKAKQEQVQWTSFRKLQKGAWARRDLNDNRIPCKDGLAVAEPGNLYQNYRCKNMDLYDFLGYDEMGDDIVGLGSSAWGWVAPNGREIGIFNQGSGAVFIEVLKDGKLQYLGRLPTQSVDNWRRDVRVLNDYAIIGSEAPGHNIQIFDMKKVLEIDPASPKIFNNETDLTGLFDDLPLGQSHNIVVDWDNEYAIAVGVQPRNDTCKSGLKYIDLSDPSKPTSPGCASEGGYVHDAQCVRYNGPDASFRGRTICLGFNEATLTVYDSTFRNGTTASEVLSTVTYPGVSYCHQGGWTESNWHQYVVLGDELDEYYKSGPAASGRPVTNIIDLTDLRNPKATGRFYAADMKAIDHNMFIVDHFVYQSNYGAGIWVHDLSSIPKDPTGNSVTVEGFFDIEPDDDAEGGSLVFRGTWGHYMFPSGFILVNHMSRGAFSIKFAEGYGAKPGKGFGGKSI